METIKTGTIGYMRAHFQHLGAYCLTPCCGHSGALDADQLSHLLGDDFDVVANRNYLLWRLVCSKCGARRPQIILHQDAIAYKRAREAASGAS